MYSVYVLLLLLLPAYNAYVLHASYNWLLNGLRSVNFLETFCSGVGDTPHACQNIIFGPRPCGARECVHMYSILLYFTGVTGREIIVCHIIRQLLSGLGFQCTYFAFRFPKLFSYAILVPLQIRSFILCCM